jgi:hypothetical protein
MGNGGNAHMLFFSLDQFGFSGFLSDRLITDAAERVIPEGGCAVDKLADENFSEVKHTGIIPRSGLSGKTLFG